MVRIGDLIECPLERAGITTDSEWDDEEFPLRRTCGYIIRSVFTESKKAKGQVKIECQLTTKYRKTRRKPVRKDPSE